jgi:tetrahydromethanopterin S-methyltransferase subunit G
VMMIRNPEGDRRQKYLTFRTTDLQETTHPIVFPSTKAALQRRAGRVMALLVGIAIGIAIGLLLSRILRR